MFQAHENAPPDDFDTISDMKIQRHRLEKDIKNCYRLWATNYHEAYYSPKAAYPPVHVALVKNILRRHRVKRLLDAGCGPASMLREFFRTRMDLYGFDLTPEMVAEARRIMKASGRDEAKIWQGSVLSGKSYRMPGKASRKFDAVLCSGVFPHLEKKNENKALCAMRAALKKRGLLVLEARNELFSLFTLNRYSRDFFAERLIDLPQLKEKLSLSAFKRLQKALDASFYLDHPPPREHEKTTPGYDAVLSRSHHPLKLKEQVARAGFEKVELFFYHFHALPPFLAGQIPELARELSLALEKKPRDLRGLFMASAFFIVGEKR
jgi:SAM-dependent methyltransferase